jgi:hypothetical protein
MEALRRRFFNIDYLFIKDAKVSVRSLYYLFQVRCNLIQVQLSEIVCWARTGIASSLPYSFKSSPLQGSLDCDLGGMWAGLSNADPLGSHYSARNNVSAKDGCRATEDVKIDIKIQYGLLIASPDCTNFVSEMPCAMQIAMFARPHTGTRQHLSACNEHCMIIFVRVSSSA